MALKQKGGEISGDAKKRRRVGFGNIDTGVEANECIKVFLVKREDEVGKTSSFCINPVDLNNFFGEDGRIYGYKDLKIHIWFSIVSFRAYAEIMFESIHNGGKGITDLEPALQSIFGESLIEKEEFLQTFSKECQYIRNIVSDGAVLCSDSSREDDQASGMHLDAEGSTIEVIHAKLHSLPVGLLYSRLVPLVLLLVEGGRPIDVTDPRWDIFLVVKKMHDSSGGSIVDLLGFATVYHFYHYPDSTRLRIGQILVLPPYQGQGHGRRLLEAVNSVAMVKNIYDVTVEGPSDYLRFLRACMDTFRLLAFEPIKPAISSAVSYLKEANLSKRICKLRSAPPANLMEIVQQKLKINKKQFRRCWEALIYLNLDTKNRMCMENFKAFISDRVKGDILDKDAEDNGKRLIEVPNDYGHDMTFVVFWSPAGSEPDGMGMDGKLEGYPATQEQQLNQLIDKEMEDIAAIAQKVSFLRNS